MIILSSRLLKQLQIEIEVRQVSTGLYMAFHRVSFATDLAANLWLQSIPNFRIMQDIVSKIAI